MVNTRTSAPGEILALIPARGGSKGVPRKNLRPLAGVPLIVYSIAAARQTRSIARTIVSTDCPEIAQVARRAGAQTPFLRPAALAQDHSTGADVLRHALEWLESNEGAAPRLIVQLLPTTPLRDPHQLDAAIQTMLARPEATSLRSVHPLPEPPQKMMGIQDGYLTGLFPHDPRPDYFNLPRQSFPPAYHPNGYVEIFRPDQLRRSGSIFGDRILALVTPHVTEIDTPEDLDYLEYQLARGRRPPLDLDQCWPGAPAEAAATPA